MKSTMLRPLGLAVLLGLCLTACTQGFTSATSQTTSEAHSDEGGPVGITGKYSITNDFIFTYYVENAVALVDMHGFVIRDQEWELPVHSQVLGFMTYDPDLKSGTFSLQLPAQPLGEFNDVDQDSQTDTGLQIFSVAYSPNQAGGPFSEGDDRSRGWPNYLASVRTDPENEEEVIGGKLIIWAPDENQEFPSGLGEDGLLFTRDDPVENVVMGYSIVDLDGRPFKFTRERTTELTLYEPADVAIKDFSSLSYTEAFEQTFQIIRKEYAFNGIEGKQPDWESLYTQIKPRVEQAEQNKDVNAFYMALRDLTWAFQDGHVALEAGDYANQDFTDATAGGYGFAIRELDDGRVIVSYILESGPALQAGMQVGAEVRQFNGQPIGEAIAKTPTYSQQSSDFARRYQQARYLLRARPGDEASVTFVNPTGGEQQVEITAVEERESFSRTSLYFGVNTDNLLPVESLILTQGNASVGYIRINNNFDDLNLVIRLFERALQQFEIRKVTGIIIDMRHNSGGANLGLAGFLTDQEIPLGQLEYYSEITGKFEAAGPRQKIYPNQNQYQFEKKVLLVGPACFSACELEAYGFSQVPGMVVVGQYPTGGVEAEAARGRYVLPEGFILQVPTGRFTLPDGSVFLEGKGVSPTLKVPVDEETVLSTEDIVLQAGIDTVLKPLGAGVEPAGSPVIAGSDESAEALLAQARFLEDAAREQYEASQFELPGNTKYTIVLTEPETLIWAYAWCASDKETIEHNLETIYLDFVLDGEQVGLDQMSTYDVETSGRQCRLIYTALKDWPGGEHHLTITASFKTPISDGAREFPVGDYVLEYTVYVKP